jgi:hypothetical protein
MKLGEDLNWPEASCCAPGWPGGCQCVSTERALRGYADGRVTMPMTPDQREYCLEQISRVEGHRREDHADDGDSDLARATLGAWTDYCRDKGLL